MNATLCLALALGAAAAEPPQGPADRLEARFAYDLGEDEVDVSGYPERIQDAYRAFRRTCSQCHTLARPINAPFVARKDWERYLERMKERTKLHAGTEIADRDRKAILDFLEHDSKERRVKRAEAFVAEAARLEGLFAEVRREQQKVKERKAKKVKTPAPYTGDRPIAK